MPKQKKISKTFITTLFAVLTLVFLGSCEGFRCAENVVQDRATNLPIDSVLVEVLSADSKIVYTDTAGKFDVCNQMGGCIGKCKDIILRFSKANYKTITITNPKKDELILMEH